MLTQEQILNNFKTSPDIISDIYELVLRDVCLNPELFPIRTFFFEKRLFKTYCFSYQINNEQALFIFPDNIETIGNTYSHIHGDSLKEIMNYFQCFGAPIKPEKVINLLYRHYVDFGIFRGADFYDMSKMPLSVIANKKVKAISKKLDFYKTYQNNLDMSDFFTKFI